MDGSRMKKLIKKGSKEVKDTILPIIVIIIDEVLRLLVVLATPDFFDNGHCNGYFLHSIYFVNCILLFLLWIFFRRKEESLFKN